ncbi:AMP-binding protein, partial [Deinococcus multiflagellatus]|uniref:AMP-binding protein n=1 Tax=Deinococcus multiflagellatus TaxID=1656887 RepID=UPI001CC985D1
MVSLFEQQAQLNPERTAIEFEGQELTYQELNLRANRLAHHLRALGVGPDVLVGICTPRNPNLIVAVLGILKAGGAYVPLDPEYPGERVKFMLRDSGTRILLTERTLTGVLETEPGTVKVFLEELSAALPGENVPGEAHGEHLAYVIYTSGSTGQPKGVQITRA